MTSPSASASSAAPAAAIESPPSIYSIEQLLKVRRGNAPRAIDDQAFVYLYDAPGTSQIHAPSAKEGEAPKQLTAYSDRVSNLRIAPGAQWPTGAVRLSVILIAVAVTWTVILPQIARWPRVAVR